MPGDEGYVRYNNRHAVLEIERPGESLEIRFDPRSTLFESRGRVYRMPSLTFGHLQIETDGTVVVKGRSTPSGIRFELVRPDLAPIARELAYGLALRSDDLARQFRVADAAVGAAPDGPYVGP